MRHACETKFMQTFCVQVIARQFEWRMYQESNSTTTYLEMDALMMRDCLSLCQNTIQKWIVIHSRRQFHNRQRWNLCKIFFTIQSLIIVKETLTEESLIHLGQHKSLNLLSERYFQLFKIWVAKLGVQS
jgi:hypothetical protein